MELFVNTQRTTDKEKERLFFAEYCFCLAKRIRTLIHALTVSRKSTSQ